MCWILGTYVPSTTKQNDGSIRTLDDLKFKVDEINDGRNWVAILIKNSQDTVKLLFKIFQSNMAAQMSKSIHTKTFSPHKSCV